ncbi:Cache domain protein [uncultured archaeon]|nr:Cache domain protein [uncultured archaeon]
MMRRSTFLFVSIVLMILLPSLGLAAEGNATGEKLSTDSNDDIAFFLLQLQAEIQGSLNDRDALVADAAERLSAAGLEGEKARKILQSLNASGFIGAATISPQGKKLTVEPSQFRAAEGTIVNQTIWSSFIKSKDPFMSQIIRLVEGNDAVTLVYPVLSPADNFTGAVCANMPPNEFLEAIIAPKLEGTPFDVWVIQKDGRILYDSNSDEEGLMLLSDPLFKPYPTLLDVGRKMIAERSGMGSYNFFLDEEYTQNETKEVYWTTVGLHGNDWRLAVTRAAE